MFSQSLLPILLLSIAACAILPSAPVATAQVIPQRRSPSTVSPSARSAYISQRTAQRKGRQASKNWNKRQIASEEKSKQRKALAAAAARHRSAARQQSRAAPSATAVRSPSPIQHVGAAQFTGVLQPHVFPMRVSRNENDNVFWQHNSVSIYHVESREGQVQEPCEAGLTSATEGIVRPIFSE